MANGTTILVDRENGKDWGNFRYCIEAIQEDTRRGFTVMEVEA